MQYTRHLEAPDIFHFWAGVATIAGALEGKVWIDMGYWKWRPNFFIIFVAPPGIVSKSFTIGIGEEMLRQVEGIHFGPNSVTWQALTTSFLESTKRVEIPGQPDYLMSAVTITASELGTLIDPRNRELIDVLVDLWDGRSVPWKRKTKAEGDSSISNPWLNIIGATTPSWMSENFPEYAIGGGFTSRTVFVYADRKRTFTAYPQKHISEEDRKLHNCLLHDLRQVATMAGEFRISEEAFAWGEEWYRSHWESKGGVSERMAGYKARKQTHIHKLAMVLSAARDNELTIELADLTAAAELLTSLEEEMPRVFSQVSDNQKVKYATALVTIIRTKERISKQALWREVIHLMTWKDFDEALDGAFKAGFLRMQQTEGDWIISPRPKEEMH